jgi:hypothetical protein
MVFDRLREIALRGGYRELAEVAGEIVQTAGEMSLLGAYAALLRAYALLRINVHQHQAEAFADGARTVEHLTSQRDESPDHADWALNIWAFMLQFVGRDAEAEAVFRDTLARPGVALIHRVAASANLAHSLTMQRRPAEAVDALQTAGAEIDGLPEVAQTPVIRRERQRIRLNTADYHVGLKDLMQAEAELNQVDQEILTPMMRAAFLVSRARIAAMRDQWDEAEILAAQANTIALDIPFAPLREKALGVLVACALRQGRYEEQERLVIEMASLRASSS